MKTHPSAQGDRRIFDTGLSGVDDAIVPSVQHSKEEARISEVRSVVEFGAMPKEMAPALQLIGEEVLPQARDL